MDVGALSDLDRIYDYYAIKNLRVAAELYNSILDETQMLTSHPYMAAIEPLLEDSKTYRSLIVAKGKYKALYYVENNTVNVLYVWNCRQNPEKLKRRLSK